MDFGMFLDFPIRREGTHEIAFALVRHLPSPQVTGPRLGYNPFLQFNPVNPKEAGSWVRSDFIRAMMASLTLWR